MIRVVTLLDEKMLELLK